jgi:hypothetical protein
MAGYPTDSSPIGYQNYFSFNANFSEFQVYFKAGLPDTFPHSTQDSTVARLFQTFPAKVTGKFEKIRPLQKILCEATFQTHFVH